MCPRKFARDKRAQVVEVRFQQRLERSGGPGLHKRISTASALQVVIYLSQPSTNCRKT